MNNITLNEDVLYVLAHGLEALRHGDACESDEPHPFRSRNIVCAGKVIEQMKQEAKLEYRFGSGWRPCGSPEERAEALIRDVNDTKASLAETVRDNKSSPAVLVNMALIFQRRGSTRALDELLTLLHEEENEND